MRIRTLVLAGLLTLSLLACSANASEDTPEPRLGFGLALGYGDGFAGRSSQSGHDVTQVQILYIEPQIQFRLREWGDGSSWFDGNLNLVLQAEVALNFEPHDGNTEGAVLGLRYLFRPEHALRPYLEIGLGMGSLQFSLQGQDDGFSFYLHSSIGIRKRLGRRIYGVASVTWQHISNAKLRRPNHGIDTIGVRLGFEYW